MGSLHQDFLSENPRVDALIEFTQGSVDSGIHNREAVRHYLIAGDEVRRVDPVALGPRDFVEEWLTRPWSESAVWSATDLQTRHQKLHGDFVSGEFLSPTLQCQTPDLWQVAFEPDSAKKDFVPESEIYFLIR